MTIKALEGVEFIEVRVGIVDGMRVTRKLFAQSKTILARSCEAESVSLHVLDEELTAFLELEAAIQAEQSIA